MVFGTNLVANLTLSGEMRPGTIIYNAEQSIRGKNLLKIPSPREDEREPLYWAVFHTQR